MNELTLTTDNDGKLFTSGSETWTVYVCKEYTTYRLVTQDGTGL